MFFRTLALALKEFLTLLRDKKSRFVIIGPPILQLVIFGYAASYDLNEVPYAVYDHDGGVAARELLAHFSGSTHFKLIENISHESRIAELIDARDVMMVVQIPRQFSAKLLKGDSSPVQVLIDGRNSNTAQLVQNYTARIVNRFNEDWAEENGLSSLPVHLLNRSWYNPNLESRWFFISGLVGVLTLVVTMLTTAMSVAREREQGTFDQLLVTPLNPVEILIGKSIPGIVIGTFLSSLVTGIAILWFGVPLSGSLLTLYTGIGLFLFAAVGVGLLISALSVTLQQALLGGFLFMVPAVILSGFATPIANMPEFVQWLTYANPMRYLLIFLRSVFLEGADLSLLTHQMWPLAVIALVSLTLAGWMFRRRMY